MNLGITKIMIKRDKQTSIENCIIFRFSKLYVPGIHINQTAEISRTVGYWLSERYSDLPKIESV